MREQDPQMIRLAEAFDNVAAEIDEHDEYVMFAFAARIDDSDTVEAYVNVIGYSDLIIDSMVGQLQAQIESGNPSLFLLLREAVSVIEEDLTEEDLLDDSMSHEQVSAPHRLH